MEQRLVRLDLFLWRSSYCAAFGVPSVCDVKVYLSRGRLRVRVLRYALPGAMAVPTVSRMTTCFFQSLYFCLLCLLLFACFRHRTAFGLVASPAPLSSSHRYHVPLFYLSVVHSCPGGFRRNDPHKTNRRQPIDSSSLGGSVNVNRNTTRLAGYTAIALSFHRARPSTTLRCSCGGLSCGIG